MKGFDAKFADLPHYILGITHEIWEERGLEKLNDYYAPDIVVRSPASVVVGNQDVIAATAATLAEFPDRQLLGEDVIWSGSPENGFLSSHRILSTATHTGDGSYGKATGSRLTYRIIADCHAIENQINDEWLIRDQAAIVRQMGLTPRNYAVDMIRRQGGADRCAQPFTPEIDKAGPYSGTGNDNEWGEKLADLLKRMMDGDGAAITECFDRGAQLEYPGLVTGHGWEAANSLWFGLRNSFPSAHFEIHHRIGRDDPMMPPRAAIRWSLTGKHDGPGYFGEPTGAQVHVMGMSHAEFGSPGAAPVRLRREWTLFDETAIWKQILMHTGEFE